jgi:hypothetical protein
MKRKLLVLLFCLFTLCPVSAYAQDAHFFVRYDCSVVDETGSSHYNPSLYFPIGSVAEGYTYGSGQSDYTSIDGQVSCDTAYIDNAANIISGSKINLYESFYTNSQNIKSVFSPVYDCITQLPSKEVVSASIGLALGIEWQTKYDIGEIDVLWYVVKQEKPYINVDGVLYYTETGEIIDKEEPAPTPEPEITPDVDTNIDNSKTEEQTENPVEEQQVETEQNTQNVNENINALPQTSDDTLVALLIMCGILLICIGSRMILIK